MFLTVKSYPTPKNASERVQSEATAYIVKPGPGIPSERVVGVFGEVDDPFVAQAFKANEKRYRVVGTIKVGAGNPIIVKSGGKDYPHAATETIAYIEELDLEVVKRV